MSFRRLRILLLLGVLAAALSFTWLERTLARGWSAPLPVEVFPINGDGSPETGAYIASLSASSFDDINAFLQRETERYGVKQHRALELVLQPELKETPPAPPSDHAALATVAWSLKLRYWVYRHTSGAMPEPGRVKLFVLYHQPQAGEALEHSLGLQKGLIGVAHVYADPRQAQQNNIVIAHELLHTLGATDKYGAGGRPVYPDGYADPELPEAMPQRRAEIMAGRFIAPSGELTMPESLERCVIGAKTAHEINLDEAFRRRYTSGS